MYYLMSGRNSYTHIDLFAGAGGMALGFDNAGFNTVLLNDNDKHCVATLKKNRPRWEVVQQDITTLSLKEYRGKVDVLSGGFPCQSFSYSGNRAGLEDTRGTLFYEFARLVEEIQPLVFVLENVRGLLSHDRGRTFSTITSILRSKGYIVKHKLLSSEYYDVGQSRKRVFIVGTKRNSGVEFLFPEPRDYVLTLRDVLRAVPTSNGSSYSENKKKVLDLVPQGGYWRDLPVEIQKEYMGKSFYAGGGKTGMARRLAWNVPSLTLTCSPAQKQTERCHPDETRPLTIREYARIQSFPDSWEFSGSVTQQYKQIGNAVPVNLAYHIARSVVDYLDRRSSMFKHGDKVKIVVDVESPYRIEAGTIGTVAMPIYSTDFIWFVPDSTGVGVVINNNRILEKVKDNSDVNQ